MSWAVTSGTRIRAVVARWPVRARLSPVEALDDTVELWGLDEHACRTMRGACAEHVPIRNSMCALPRP